MTGSSFDLIAQELQKQLELMKKLEAENRELRQQLADLREGRGIFVEINGIAIALDSATSAPAPQAQPVTPHLQGEPPTIVDAPTIAITNVTAKASETKEAENAPGAQTTGADAEQKAQPSFLEEAMIDEFSTAMTSPLAVWQGPQDKKTPPIDEQQKAALRKELMGSYILE